jgi:phosphoribosylanthranilate isomerase
MEDSTEFSANPNRTRVKICGITNLEDALLAVEAGADYLGFIFYRPSQRSITVKKAQPIVAELRRRPDLPPLVGVFVNETAAAMAHVLATCKLDLAQLSGDETPNFIGDHESPIFGRCYKVLRPATLDEAEAEAEWYLPAEMAPNQPSLLIDTKHATLYGGTGQTADWTIAARLAQEFPNLMLAGGLNPDNVAAAVDQVRPFAVDVASGVEARPGKKDPRLVRAFIANAKSPRPGGESGEG